MRVLGIDPAAAGATGYGIVETDGRGFRVLRFGAHRPLRAASAAARLRAVHELLGELVEKYEPDAVAVEAAFTALNRQTALRLAEVRGVVLLAAAQHDLPVHSYAPREVKACVTGHGHAEKHQVQQMVRVLLGLPRVPEPSDAADALAVALCHLQMVQARDRFAAATRAVRPEGEGAARSRPRVSVHR